MRRSDREITDLDEIEAILRAGKVCHLGMVDAEGLPYVLPLNYGVEREGERFTLYFHSADEGRKLEVLAQNPQVCAVVSQHGEIIGQGLEACRYGISFESVMGFGQVELLQDEAAKTHVMQVLMDHLAGEKDWQFLPENVKRTAVFRLQVERISAKRRATPSKPA